MAWITSYSGTDTFNIGPLFSNLAEAVFHLKELLKAAGWTIPSSSDGSTYNASGDEITDAGSGAGGMNNNSAWFRIQDPGALREYVFQRQTNGYTWKMIYSASAKFTGGSPSATVIPTATDEQGIAKGLTTGQVMLSNENSYFHIAAQNAAHNGVYAWWLAQRGVTPDSTPTEALWLCEAMDATYSTSDSDPCIHICSDDTGSSGTLINGSASQEKPFCWMRYGEVDEEWSGIATTVLFGGGGTLWPSVTYKNPHTDKYVLMPPGYFRNSTLGSIIGFKGVGKYFRWMPINNVAYPVTFTDGAIAYLSWYNWALPGFPSGVVPLC